jgi:site-specific recombinase XerD
LKVDSLKLEKIHYPSRATDLLRKGVPIHIVQKIMGHSSIDVTQIYEHLDERDLKNAVKWID